MDTKTKLQGIMEDTGKTESQEKRRAYSRITIDKNYNVQLVIDELESVFQFRLLNISLKGRCILVEEGSEVLNHIKVGSVFEILFNPKGAGVIESLKTEVRYITKDDSGIYDGHYLVGLSILKKKNVLP